MPQINFSPTLSIDSALAARLVAAIRRLYPTVATPAMTDLQVAQAWLRYQFIELLAVDAQRQAAPDPDAQVSAAAAAVFQKASDAAAQARTDAGVGITPP
jgi:hypothetical protein